MKITKILFDRAVALPGSFNCEAHFIVPKSWNVTEEERGIRITVDGKPHSWLYPWPHVVRVECEETVLEFTPKRGPSRGKAVEGPA